MAHVIRQLVNGPLIRVSSSYEVSRSPPLRPTSNNSLKVSQTLPDHGLAAAPALTLIVVLMSLHHHHLPPPGYSLRPDGVQFVYRADGRLTGEAFVTFVNPEDARAAHRAKDRSMIGSRYVELFPSTAEECARLTASNRGT